MAEPATATGQPHRDPHPVSKPLAAKRMDANTAAPVLGPRWSWTHRRRLLTQRAHPRHSLVGLGCVYGGAHTR